VNTRDACEGGAGMQNVCVVTDTVAGIPPNFVDEYGIKVIPVGNIYDGRWYLGGVTITPSEAYDLLPRAHDTFQTSAVAPGHLFDAFLDLGTAPRDILLSTLSSALSAFYESASLRCFLSQASGVGGRVAPRS
jgi:fatty acid-binding protein DegV